MPKQSYRQLLQEGVRMRHWPLDSIEHDTVVNTGRNISTGRGAVAWKGDWPVLREFLQNTVDHLHLFECGKRNPSVNLIMKEGEKKENKNLLAEISFVIVDNNNREAGSPHDSVVVDDSADIVCTMLVEADEVIIEQRHTFPLHQRAIDTGVPDTMKQGNNKTAGGFGDGFKTAAAALLANDDNSLVWEFFSDGTDAADGKPNQMIKWDFQREHCEAIGTFAESSVLQVHITKVPNSTTTSIKSCFPNQNNVMRQVISAKNIGHSFLKKAVPRFQVFWDLPIPDSDDYTDLLVTRKTGGGDCMGPADKQPVIGGGIISPDMKPEAGIYIKGIWVCQPKIIGSILCLNEYDIDVTGRDRNDVDHDQLVEAVAHIWKESSKHQNKAFQKLLEPLRKTRDRSIRQNWLLRSRTFLDDVLSENKEFVLRKIFDVPQNAMFVSSESMKNQDAFSKWSCQYLQRKGITVVPINSGADTVLFNEESEWNMKHRCVKFLNEDLKVSKIRGTAIDDFRKMFQKVLKYIGASNVQVRFTPDVDLVFFHESQAFVSSNLPFTGKLLMQLVGLCQGQSCQIDIKKVASLIQAIANDIAADPASGLQVLSKEDVDQIIEEAVKILNDNEKLLLNSKANSSRDKTAEDVQNNNDKMLLQSKEGAIRENSKGPASNENERDGQSLEDKAVIAVPGKPQDNPKAGNDNQGNEKEEAQMKKQRSNAQDIAALSNKIDLQAEKDKDRKMSDNSFVEGGQLAEHNAGKQEDWHPPHSDLKQVTVEATLGGGTLLCNETSAQEIQSGSWDSTLCEHVRVHRSILVEAVRIVGLGMPSVKPFLCCIEHGFDGANATYRGFCNNKRKLIVINLFAYTGKFPRPRTLHDARALLYAFVTTVTHELAHMFEQSSGHGVPWYNTHMKLLQQTTHHLKDSEETLTKIVGTESSERPRKRFKLLAGS